MEQNILNIIVYSIIFCFLIITVPLFFRIVSMNRRAKSDYKTDLMNYQTFIERGNRLLTTVQPNEYTILLIDIADFNYINRTYSPESADTVLTILTQFIQNAIKIVAQEKFLLTRAFADQFILLCRTKIIKDLDQYTKSQEGNLRAQIQEQTNININLRFNVGEVCISEPKKDIQVLIGEAYYANKECKNNYKTSAESFQQIDIEKKALEKTILYRIDKKLFENTLQVYLQPKYDLNNEQIIGAESLIRWIEQGEIVYFPDQFIPVFEKYGFIEEVDLYMFEQVCRISKDLKLMERDDITISVNISRSTILKPNISEQFRSIAKQYQIEPEKIEIEITEGGCTAYDVEIANQIQDIKQHGFILSLDDFGTGKSTLTNVNFFDMDIIKLDRYFLMNQIHKPYMTIMLKNLIQLMHELELSVIAEGVETIEDVETLRELGCDMVQGYYFSRPIPEAQFFKLIE